jgi:hypothetical protein
LQVLAHSLTYLEVNYLSAIPPSELYNAKWKQELRGMLAPNVVNMINHFNKVSSEPSFLFFPSYFISDLLCIP